ncbi:hypothetical protein MHU86_16913 [Fragilaria crotonensis]|nr:hypothetical protein MHU86_16913 [Fragilaria crotonensis]
MTDLPVGSPRDGSVPSVVRGISDDASDVTPPGGRGGRTNVQHLVEKTVKFRFLLNNNGEPVSPSKIHLHWIQAVQEYCGADIQIMNNNGQTMPIVDTMRWTIGQHSKQFQIHHSNSRSRVGDTVQGEHQKYIASPKGSALIIHRIRTSVTLSEIKNIPKVYRLLRDNNCFLTEHRWTEDIWDTTQLGFVMGLDPQFYDVATATENCDKTYRVNCRPGQNSKVSIGFHHSTDQTLREDHQDESICNRNRKTGLDGIAEDVETRI